MRRIICSLCVVSCGILVVQGQDSEAVRQLRQELRDATENFEKALQEQRRVIEDLNKRIETLQQGRTNAKAVALESSAESDLRTNVVSRGPLGLSRGNVYLDVGLVGTFAAGTSTASDIEGGTQLGGHDPNQRGFTVQGVEATFSGAVDPYFRGTANLLFSVDSGGESFFELEEGYLETTSLPGNLQLRGGIYLTEFGRHNVLHPHGWAFVDAPIINARLLGPDGLRNPGARLSWLMPTPFYSEIMLGVQNSSGETASSFRSSGHHHGDEDEAALPFAFRHPDNDRGVSDPGDLLFAPRYAISFDLNDSQTLLLGVSGAFGPNASGAGDSTDTQIYGLDLMWKWKPVRHFGGFPFVAFQTEAMLRRYEAGRFDWDENGDGIADPGELVDTDTGLPAVLPGESLIDYGFYSQLLYGFRKGWIAGLRFDYADRERADYETLPFELDGEAIEHDFARTQRWRVSPNLTWFPTEFSKVRLQYNYDDREGIGRDHSLWLQVEFILGAHAAHKF